MVILREGHFDVESIARAVSDDLILKARDEAAGAKLQRIVLALAAVKRDAVDAAVEIDLHGVSVLGCAVGDCHQAGILLQLSSDRVLDILVGDSHVSLLDLDALILSEGDVRLHSDSRGVDQVLACLDLGHVDLRSGDDIKAALLRSVRIGFVDAGIDCALKENALAVELLDHLLRCMSLAETRKAVSSLFSVVGLLHRLREILCRDGDGDDRHALFLLLNLNCHNETSS